MKIGDKITRRSDGLKGVVVGFEAPDTMYFDPIIVKWDSNDPKNNTSDANHVTEDEIEVVR